MNVHEYRSLREEEAYLVRSLERGVSSLIERITAEERLREVQGQLASERPPTRPATRVRITFSGKPVPGDRGIRATFAMEAVQSYCEAVAAVGVGHHQDLGSRGPIPGREAYDMMIVGTAVGSFGFELEESASAEQLTLFPEAPVLTLAIDRTNAILRAALGTDDDFAMALEETDQRAMEALGRFVLALATAEAWCSISSGDDHFRFADVEQVRRTAERLKSESILDEIVDLAGHLVGALPEHRTFEFKTADRVLFGRLAAAIDPNEVNRDWLFRPIRAEFRRRQVGSGKPRFVLMAFRPSGQGAAETR